RRTGIPEVDAVARAGFERFPDWDRRQLALCLDRFRLAVLDGVICGAVGRLANEDAVDRGGGLQASCRVDHVAGGHALTLRRPRAESDQRLARVDRDSN